MTEAPRAPKGIFRHYDPERDKRDMAVILAHEEAITRGEMRCLLRTVDGELFSYKKEEIGFITGGSGAKITTGTGMLVGGGLCWLAALAMAVFTILEQGPTPGERGGLFFVAAMFASTAWYLMHLGLAEHRARKLRKARGLPKPSLAAELHLP